MNWTAIISAVILIICGVITAYVIPFVKSKTNESQRNILKVVAKTVVYAAEQLFGAGAGEDKLTYALTHIKNVLTNYNISIDTEAIRDAVEDSVKEMNMYLETFTEGEEKEEEENSEAEEKENE